MDISNTNGAEKKSAEALVEDAETAMVCGYKAARNLGVSRDSLRGWLDVAESEMDGEVQAEDAAPVQKASGDIGFSHARFEVAQVSNARVRIQTAAKLLADASIDVSGLLKGDPTLRLHALFAELSRVQDDIVALQDEVFAKYLVERK